MRTSNRVRHATGQRPRRFRTIALLSSVVVAYASSSWAQDTVTIPKSRLEELERKESELQKLKQGATNAPAGNVPTVPTPYNAPPAATTIPGGQPPTPIPTRVSPPAASLPPLTQGEIVDALDMANQYLVDVPSSDKRYRGQKIIVRGEIVGFEKPMFVRNYKVLLSGPDRSTRVVCDLITPRKYSAAYTIDHGNQIVGQFGENRETFGRVGQVVLVHGHCKGWKDGSVVITADWFELAH